MPEILGVLDADKIGFALPHQGMHVISPRSLEMAQAMHRVRDYRVEVDGLMDEEELQALLGSGLIPHQGFHLE